MKLSNTILLNEKLLPTGKKAFTLAEVLITLTILGVVAAIAVPNLIRNYQDKVTVTQVKKAYSMYLPKVKKKFFC